LQYLSFLKGVFEEETPRRLEMLRKFVEGADPKGTGHPSRSAAKQKLPLSLPTKVQNNTHTVLLLLRHEIFCCRYTGRF